MKIVSRGDAGTLGLNRYFTGDLCKNGHVSERYAKSSKCVKCNTAYMAKYHAVNKEKESAQKKEHYRNNPSPAKARSRKYRRNNPEKVCECSRKWVIANADKVRQHKRKHYLNNIERYSVAAKLWQKNNPEKVRKSKEKYRKKNLGLYAFHSKNYYVSKLGAMPSWADYNEIMAIYIKAGNLGLSVDHIVPLRGKLVCGLHVGCNLQLLSNLDNSSKSNKFDVWVDGA